jgi:hypothetical protein
MQSSAHRPSPFICSHLGKLLPDWSLPAASVLIVLQFCTIDLLKRTPETEAHKQILRQQFLQFGYEVAAQLNALGHLAEVFDPRTGLPLLSRPGLISLDDVAIVRACLGYPTLESRGCSVILHPTWGSFVYPSTMLSSAEPALLELVSRNVKGFTSLQTGLPENHQSLSDGDKLTEYRVMTIGSRELCPTISTL